MTVGEPGPYPGPMPRVTVACLALLAACAAEDAPLPPAELAAVCGADGPVRVLALDPGERLTAPPRAHDGRVLMQVGTYDVPTPTGSPPWPEDTALWSTGPCGEAPVRREPVQALLTSERWPDVLLGQRQFAGELVVLDASGATPGHVAFTGLGASRLYWTDHGVVSFAARSEDVGAALIHPYPADIRRDTATGEVLAELVRVNVYDDRVFETPRSAVAVLPDALLVIRPDDALVRVDLASRASEPLAAGVLLFVVSPDGRWLVWQSVASSPEDLSGPVFLRDLESGDEHALGTLRLTGTAFRHYDAGLLVVDVDGYTDRPQRVFKLPTRESVDLPARRSLAFAPAQGRWVIEAHIGDGLELFDPATGEATPLLDRGVVVHRGADELEVLGVRLCCAFNDATYADEGPLLAVGGDGEVRRLAARATRGGDRGADGRWLFGLDIDADQLGALAVMDPAAATTSAIDERVFAYTAGWTTAFGDDPVVVYSVDDGQRTGVWLADPANAP